MHLESYLETIRACRFCFMCRHLSAVGNVTFRESDTPRGRALILDRVVANPRLLDVSDFCETLYDADLSAACRQHCVSHYDEAGLILAARRDLVEAGREPVAVRTLRDELVGSVLTSRGDPAADVVYYEASPVPAHQPEITAAMENLMAAAGVPYRIVSSGDSGKGLLVLGYPQEARALAQRTAKEIARRTVRILVTSCPAAFDGFRNDYPGLGVALGEHVEVLHSSDFILRLLEEGRLKVDRSHGLKVFPLASDYLRNYATGYTAVARLLAALGVEALPFGTNGEESYSVGEGAVVLDRLNPRLVEKLSRQVVSRMRDPANDVLLTASPYTKSVLLRYGGQPIRVTTVEEIAYGLASNAGMPLLSGGSPLSPHTRGDIPAKS